MWRKATKLGMLRKITSSILKEVSEDATKVRHIYGKSKKVSGQGYKYTGIGRNGEVVSRYVVMDNWKPLALSRVRHYCSAATKGIKSTSSSEEDGQEEKYDVLRERQVRVETEAWNNAAREYEELLVIMCEKKLAPNIPYVKSLFLDWFEPFKNAISAQCKDRKSCWGYSSCLNELPADMMAVITMHKLMALLMMVGGHSSVTVFQASSEIGQAIEQEAKLLRFLEKSKGKASADVEDAPTNEQVKLGVKVTHLMKQQKVHQIRRIVQQHDASKPWGPDKQLKVGSRLLQLLLETAYVQPPVDHSPDAPPDFRPAFIHIKKSLSNAKKGAKRFGVIKCDPLVRQVLEKSAGRHLVIPYMPMVVPPLDWMGYDKGAYLFLPSYIMRTVASRQRVALKSLPKGQFETVFEALNALGNTKWRINKAVLSIIDRIWASGGSLAGLVDRKDIPLPKEPGTDDASEINKWKGKVKNVKKKNEERHSQRCDVELKLAVARKLKDECGFYYPHNLDFRGRAYPMHPHLNHLGSDLCRGILEFAEGRPLRASGLRWLKIHLANLYAGGVDKLSFEDRIAFTENHLEDVFDSADRPLEGGRWWLNAEDPFQCLGACMNLTEALRSSSPEDYVSHMTVHQDGSCNGLQHYGALGRDKLGAKAVNLAAGDKPADVYSDIAKRVLEIMRMDAEKDPSIEPNAPLAKLLLDQVDRKLVKQTVMTSVYGVTYIGAHDQIKKRLKERDVIADDRELFAAACYAAKLTMFAQGEIFEAARGIMSWLGDCARKIASENQPVHWTTPLGLPVVQPYRHLGKHQDFSTSFDTSL